MLYKLTGPLRASLHRRHVDVPTGEFNSKSHSYGENVRLPGLVFIRSSEDEAARLVFAAPGALIKLRGDGCGKQQTVQVLHQFYSKRYSSKQNRNDLNLSFEMENIFSVQLQF